MLELAAATVVASRVFSAVVAVFKAVPTCAAKQ